MTARILCALVASIYVNSKVQANVLSLDNSYSTIAAGVLSAAFSMLIWAYGKWFLYLFKRSSPKVSWQWRLFDSICVPASPIYIFTVPFWPEVVFKPFFIISLLISALAIKDSQKTLEGMLWDRRFHGFDKLPDSGAVTKRDLLNKKWLILSLYFGLPAAIYLAKPLYSLSIL